MVGTGRFELPTPRTPSECSTRLSHVPTDRNPLRRAAADGVDLRILHYGSNFVGQYASKRRRRALLRLDGRDVRPPQTSVLLSSSLCQPLRFFFEHGKLNFLLHRIDAIHKNPYPLAQAVGLAGALAYKLARGFIIAIAVVS